MLKLLISVHFYVFSGADNQFNLVCDVEDGAEPEPIIEWLKNGEVILKDSIQGIVISDEKIDFIGKFFLFNHLGYKIFKNRVKWILFKEYFVISKCYLAIAHQIGTVNP